METVIKSHNLIGNDSTRIEAPEGEGWRAVSFVPKPMGSVEDADRVLVLWERAGSKKGGPA
jgi:hypothetical protein